MDEPYRRLSMNTILMKARIFDEHSSEEDSMDKFPDNHPLAVKKETEEDGNCAGQSTEPNISRQETIKEEPIDMEEDSRSNFPCNVFEKLDLKKEYNVTPVKLEVEENSNDARDLLPRRNVKRAVFSKESPFKEGKSSKDSPYKTRQSPYKRPEQMNPNHDQLKSFRKRRKTDLETDPEVLRRRQKQIDYGKNTVGYDIYIQTVQKSERQSTDPQTPDKYQKYSRRGFDGLIKQWRLKLHKYDPPEDE